MLIMQRTVISSTLSAYLFPTKNGRKFRRTSAKKGDIGEKAKIQQPIFPLRVSNVSLARSVVAILGLGFIDAGYSGDWSRIGVISKQTEDFLKLGAYLASPLCLFLIFSITKEDESGDPN